MSKPIFIVKLSCDVYDSIQSKLSKELHDYHVLIVNDPQIRKGEVLFECYNSPKSNKRKRILK